MVAKITADKIIEASIADCRSIQETLRGGLIVQAEAAIDNA